ncbi:transcriptional attenuator, LytR family [Lentzea xinjiangensis]|uniref:Transcriptional attenuator, LytR family n=2 Tax=Lentzea xinjiangensis TaxID=402600 RepID=A0A1H9ASU3_9PSEU|nr:transcriptional attenuator, LytR family [Lentzea xinjiangensis]
MPDPAPQNFAGEQTGRRRRPDAPAEQTGNRPRPQNGAYPPPGEQPGQRPRPDAPGMQRRPAPGDPNGAVRRPEADPRRRPAPGEMGPGGVPRRPAPGDVPSSNGIPRPPIPGDVPSSNGIPRPPAPGDPRRMPPGDAPSANGIPRRPAPEAGGAPRRPAPDVNGAPPRRLAPGDAPSATGLPRPPAPAGPPDAGAPRRLLPGDAPSSNTIARPPAPGEGPEPAGRRPMPPNGDVSGRHPMPPRAESSGPRPMPPRAESSGPRPVPGAGGPAIANRLGAAPDAPAEEPKADAPGPEATQIAPAAGVAKVAPAAGVAKVAPAAGVAKVEKREDMDPSCLTTEMEAIGDDVKKRREVDHTLARFSAVHDELLEQERQRKERRAKLMPWVKDEDEEANEEATQFAAPVSPDGDDDAPPRTTGRTPQQRRLMRGAKVSAIAAAAAVFASTGIAWSAMQWADSKFQRIDALGGNSQAVQQAEKQLGDENFLLVGSDTRAGAKAGDNVGTQAQEGGARSDVIMLAHIPADRKRIVVVSLPRDVRVDRPACRSWNPDTGQYAGPLAPEKAVMANSIYNDGGPECVANMMTQLSGLKINHFVSIDFNGFREMSTAIGGVEICTPKAIIDDELGVVIDKPGKILLKGDQALQFVRARKVAGDSGTDFDRIKRQQQFLSAMLRQSLSNEVLLSPTKLNNFINALTSSTVGDNIDVASLLELANSMQSLEAGRVSFVTMPHWTDEGPTKSNDDNIERLQDEEVKKLFQTVIDGTPLPQEKVAETKPGEQPNAPVQQQPGTVIDPKEVTIQVLNGDPTNGGAADRTANALQQKGFQVARRGNSPENASKTTIRYAKGNENKAATLKAAVPSAELVEAPEMGGAILLTLGANFDDRVVAPQGGTNQGQAQKQGQGTSDLSIVNAAQDPCAK